LTIKGGTQVPPILVGFPPSF